MALRSTLALVGALLLTAAGLAFSSARASGAPEVEPGPGGPDRATTIYLLRHAEKSDESDASGLTDAGQSRARALAELLAAEPIALVLSSQYARTRLTVQLLADRVGLTVEEIDAHDYDRFAARARALEPGQAAVVCGHSNTIPVIAARLGVASPPAESEVVYGDLYVVRLEGQRASFERRRYGDP